MQFSPCFSEPQYQLIPTQRRNASAQSLVNPTQKQVNIHKCHVKFVLVILMHLDSENLAFGQVNTMALPT